MPMAMTAYRTAATGSTHRSAGNGPPRSPGTNTANRTAPTISSSELMIPSVTQRPIADRDSDQAGSRTGGGTVVTGRGGGRQTLSPSSQCDHGGRDAAAGSDRVRQ